MKIYFAGSIRGGRDDKDIYLEIIRMLQQYGTVLTEHIGDPNLTNSGEAIPDSEIFKRDMDWVKESDIVVAEVTNPSLGVGYELGQAQSMGKKIVCLYRTTGEKRLSGMIEGNDYMQIIRYTTVNELPSMLDKIIGSSLNH